MRTFLIILLILSPHFLYAQSPYDGLNEHCDSIIIGLLKEHQCSYFFEGECIKICEERTEEAKLKLDKIIKSVYPLFLSVGMEPRPYCYEVELRYLCSSMNIIFEERFASCGSDYMYETCYRRYLIHDLKLKHGQ